jgi:hypothetical protein
MALICTEQEKDAIFFLSKPSFDTSNFITKTIYLTNKNSLRYILDKNFRYEVIDKLIKDRKYSLIQIGIDISFTAFNNFQELLKIEGIYSLNLTGTSIINVPSFKYVKRLNLSFTKVYDVSALGHIQELNLSNTLVTDVSGLGKVRILNLIQ